MKAKVYYANGRVETVINDWKDSLIDISVKSRREIPHRGVIAVLNENEEQLQTGFDYYIFVNQRWQGVDFFGLMDFLKEAGLLDYGVGWKKINLRGEWQEADYLDVLAFIEAECPVLFGRWVMDSEYNEILQKARYAMGDPKEPHVRRFRG